MPNLIDDLKPHLASGGNDTEMEGVLAAAIGLVAAHVGPLEPVEVVEHHAARSVLILRQAPVVEIVSIAGPGGVVSPAQYELDKAAGLVHFTGGVASGSCTVTYSAGREELPAGIRLAILIVAAHLWETQRVPGRAGVMGQQTAAAAATVPMGFAIPNRAATLMAPYRLPALP